ncbi:hypothetical protein LINGRAHAP2_LOCUS35052, partial [Linum grandiflorum]
MITLKVEFGVHLLHHQLQYGGIMGRSELKHGTRKNRSSFEVIWGAVYEWERNSLP